MPIDEPQIIERQGPNPAYEDLEDLRAAVERARSLHADCLDGAVRLMGEGVWQGPTTATTFGTELAGRKAELPGHFDTLVAAVEERMAQVPRTRTVRTEVW